MHKCTPCLRSISTRITMKRPPGSTGPQDLSTEMDDPCSKFLVVGKDHYPLKSALTYYLIHRGHSFLDLIFADASILAPKRNILPSLYCFSLLIAVRFCGNSVLTAPASDRHVILLAHIILLLSLLQLSSLLLAISR